MTMRAEKVFKPGAYPTYTYVSRHYEDTVISRTGRIGDRESGFFIVPLAFFARDN